jgi:hypothetical protein
MKLIQKRPEDRFQSIQQLKGVLIEMGIRNKLIDAPNGFQKFGRNTYHEGAVSKITKSISDRVHASHSRLHQPSTSEPLKPTQESILAAESNSLTLEASADQPFWKTSLPDRQQGGGGAPLRKVPYSAQALSTESNRRSAPRIFLRLGLLGVLCLTVASFVIFPNALFSAGRRALNLRPRLTVFPGDKKEAVTTTNVPVPVTSAKNVDKHSDSSDLKRPLSFQTNLSQGAADRKIAQALAKGGLIWGLSLRGLDGLTEQGIRALRDFKSLSHLDLSGTNLKNSDVRLLIGNNLHLLLIDDNLEITDVSLNYLSKIPTLEGLSLAHTGITDAGLKHLARSQLSHLVLEGDHNITGVGIKNLDPDFSHIQSLNLTDCNIDDLCARDFIKFRFLDKLDLDHNPGVSDRTIQRMEQKSSAFKWLVFNGDHISDVGVHSLTHFRKLTILDLSEIDLSQRAIADLAGMKQLKKLFLYNCGLTPNSLKVLKKALPHTEIVTTSAMSCSIKGPE